MNQTIENFIRNLSLDDAIIMSKQYLNVHFTKEELINVYPIMKNRYKEYFEIIRRDKLLYDIQANCTKETFRKILICIERAKIILKEKK